MLGALLAIAAAAAAQDVPRPTRLRIYEVRTALRFDEGELHRRRRDFLTDYLESCRRDPVPRAGAVSTIALAFSFRTLLPQALLRRYSPRRAFPFQRGEPCARVFLFQPLLPTTRYNHPPSCKISSEAPAC